MISALSFLFVFPEFEPRWTKYIFQTINWLKDHWHVPAIQSTKWSMNGNWNATENHLSRHHSVAIQPPFSHHSATIQSPFSRLNGEISSCDFFILLFNHLILYSKFQKITLWDTEHKTLWCWILSAKRSNYKQNISTTGHI